MGGRNNLEEVRMHCAYKIYPKYVIFPTVVWCSDFILLFFVRGYQRKIWIHRECWVGKLRWAKKFCVAIYSHKTFLFISKYKENNTHLSESTEIYYQFPWCWNQIFRNQNSIFNTSPMGKKIMCAEREVIDKSPNKYKLDRCVHEICLSACPLTFTKTRHMVSL